MDKKELLKAGIRFHGHLGPYLVLGLLAGGIALKKLNCKKHFGVKVKVYGATEKPKSCLIDGLQLSTGATFGKGNILKVPAKKIKIAVSNTMNNKKLEVSLKAGLVERLSAAKTHRDSEELALDLYKSEPSVLFKLT
ncbi:MAG: hypothetical protein C4533_02480 [Candidatus Omnitrophota bacterium]|jgi:formylmethanofuran dehydrogenase subunit E|nr:MAG: hypothetical protein C4533_02480 [Candidatus Omnitrophota bacterium]